jgi:hypothetical protein
MLQCADYSAQSSDYFSVAGRLQARVMTVVELFEDAEGFGPL